MPDPLDPDPSDPLAWFCGVVVWCRTLDRVEAARHAYGVEFSDTQAIRRARLMEQICHIEAYREIQRVRFGRQLTSNQAVEEWIARYASRFPG